MLVKILIFIFSFLLIYQFFVETSLIEGLKKKKPLSSTASTCDNRLRDMKKKCDAQYQDLKNTYEKQIKDLKNEMEILKSTPSTEETTALDEEYI